jgi:hypothetical protein
VNVPQASITPQKISHITIISTRSFVGVLVQPNQLFLNLKCHNGVDRPLIFPHVAVQPFRLDRISVLSAGPIHLRQNWVCNPHEDSVPHHRIVFSDSGIEIPKPPCPTKIRLADLCIMYWPISDRTPGPQGIRQNTGQELYCSRAGLQERHCLEIPQ